MIWSLLFVLTGFVCTALGVAVLADWWVADPKMVAMAAFFGCAIACGCAAAREEGKNDG